MSESITIRDATTHDVDIITEMHNAMIDEGTPGMDVRRLTIEQIRSRIEAFTDREAYLLLERGGEVIGWGLIKRYSPRGGYRFCAETSIYIRPSYRRNGWGTLLKRALLERCKSYHYHHLIARIWEPDKIGAAFCRHIGYEFVGIQNEIGCINGHWQDVIVMQLVFETEP